MLDRLLGRAALKERIAELEEENRRLERQVDSAKESRADAVSARQEAERRVNRLEDRVAELEDRVDREAGEPAAEFRGREPLRGARLREVLARLRSVETGPEGALTAMVADADAVPDPVADLLGDRVALARRAAPCLVVGDDAGLVSATLRPPLAPDTFAEWGEGFRLPEEWFRPTGRFAFALVRSDLFALAEYDGEDRGAVEGFESDVMGDHSKGGFSQARFERRRDEQVEAHLDRCREALVDRDADRLFLVGERTVLGEFADAADRTAAVDAGGNPEDALADAFRSFWTTRLFRL